MSETLPGYSAYTKGSPEPPTPQEVIERMRKALFDARAIVVVSRIELEEDSCNGRVINILRNVERTLMSGLIARAALEER